MSANCNVITVEPVLFLFMLSVFMQFPAFQDLQYSKVCQAEYALSVCDDLYSVENSAALDWVQTHASYWALAATLALSLPAILVSSLLGSWSDSMGRKLPMMIPSVGGAVSALVYLCMSVIPEAPIHLILLGCLLTGICGGFSGCTMATMSYVADVSSAGGRTTRVMLLEGMTFLGGTLGPLIAGALMPITGRETLFTIILVSHLSVVAYICFVLPQVRRNPEDMDDVGENLLSMTRFKQSIRTSLKRRDGNQRISLILYLLSTLIVMIVENGEMSVIFFKLKDEPLEWKASQISFYVALRFGVGSLMLLMTGPLLMKLALSDIYLCMLGLASRIAALLWLGFSNNSFMVWTVPFISALSSFSTPALRSLISKQIQSYELGRVFACMSMLENVSLLLASAIFNSLYPIFRQIAIPGATFHTGALLLILPFLFVWYTSKYQHSPKEESCALKAVYKTTIAVDKE